MPCGEIVGGGETLLKKSKIVGSALSSSLRDTTASLKGHSATASWQCQAKELQI